MEQKKNVNVCWLNIAWGTNWLETTIVIQHASPNVGPNKTRCAVIVRYARQRNFGVHGVIHERSDSP